MSEADKIPALGRLRTLDLRQVWPSEPYSFTPWLAQADNLQFLAETVGLPGLELVATERQVDIFSADIVAKAADTGETVLIENQIERSDHTHLGQILTYAAGLEAAIIIWVAQRFTEGHRAAVDWMNRITGADFAFFAVEVEALQIGDSVPAPRFNVVSRPNDWARSLRAVSHSPEAEQIAAGHQTFWDGYEAVAKTMGAPTRIAPQQVRSTNYYVKTVVPQVYYSLWRALSLKSIGVYISMYGEDAERIYWHFENHRENIEGAFRGRLTWRGRSSGSSFWIIAGEMSVTTDEADWRRQHVWMAELMKRLADAFGPALASLPAVEGA